MSRARRSRSRWPTGSPAATATTVKRMGKLVDQGLKGVAAGESPATQQERLDEFHASAGQGVRDRPRRSGAATEEDSGETALFTTDDPRDAYGKLSVVMGSAPPESDVQGIGDFFGKVWNGAKDALRVGSYFQMKGRAGDIGRSGLGVVPRGAAHRRAGRAGPPHRAQLRGAAGGLLAGRHRQPGAEPGGLARPWCRAPSRTGRSATGRPTSGSRARCRGSRTGSRDRCARPTRPPTGPWATGTPRRRSCPSRTTRTATARTGGAEWGPTGTAA